MTSALSITMPAYSSVFLATGAVIEEGDKIILPDSVLHALLARFGQQPLPQPLLFRIRNEAIGRVSHCGVLEFTAQDEAAFLPSWMMENLILADGANVVLDLVQLPKLNFVKLRPLQYAFTSIPNPKAALEDTLHRYTALTRGDTILARYHHEDYLLQITAVRPERGDPPAGCVIDATIEVEFDPPAEEGPHIDEVTVLQLDRPDQGHVTADHYKYYRVKIADPSQSVQISIEGRSVDARPDLYVSTAMDKPTATQNQWSGGVLAPVLIQPTDAAFSSSWYYLAVHSYAVPAAFVVKVTQMEPKMICASPLVSDSGGGGLSSTFLGHDPDAVSCQNCGRQIPSASAQMHQIMCARNNWLCPICRKVINVRERDNHSHCDKCEAVFPVADAAKHRALFHSTVTCRCGAELDAVALPAHQSEQCIFRLSSCKWCSESFPLNQVWDHEPMCGSKTTPCPRCQRPIARRQLDVHNAVEHGVNPCLDSSGNRNTAEAEQAAALARQAQDIAATYGDHHHVVAQAAPTEDVELQRAIQASLEAQFDEDEMLARAIAESMAAASGSQ